MLRTEDCLRRWAGVMGLDLRGGAPMAGGRRTPRPRRGPRVFGSKPCGKYSYSSRGRLVEYEHYTYGPSGELLATDSVDTPAAVMALQRRHKAAAAAAELTAAKPAAKPAPPRLLPYAIYGMIPFGGVASYDDGAQQLQAGCFAESLGSGKPIRLLLEHDKKRIVASIVDATLDLWEDLRGLHLVARPYDTAAGRDAVDGLRSGALRGLSPGGFITGQADGPNRHLNVTRVWEYQLDEISLGERPRLARTELTLQRR